MTPDVRVEDLLRELAPQVLGVLMRRYEDFTVCGDAVQDALVAALQHWTKEGIPSNPRSWLVTAASRAVVDEWLSVSARRRREETVAALERRDYAPQSGQDDSFVLLLMCCHPLLPVPSQLALTLRAVGGLTTSEIARAFLVPEATMAKRISRAKQQLRSAGVQFDLPPEAEWPGASRSSCTCSTCCSARATPPPQAQTSSGRISQRRPSGWRSCCTSSSPGTARSQGCWH